MHSCFAVASGHHQKTMEPSFEKLLALLANCRPIPTRSIDRKKRLGFPSRLRISRLPNHFGPVGVEELAFGLVDALVGVGTEEVALGLEQVGGEALGAVAVVVAEGG